jgi:hypothetical protein
MANEGTSERIKDANLVELATGQYWRALAAIEDESIDKDEVLLLESIRDVDDQPHTIILRAHPSKWHSHHEGHRFLVDDFLCKFVLEPDFENIRNRELGLLQKRLAELQGVVSAPDAKAPQEYIAKQLKAWEKEQKIKKGDTTNLPEVDTTSLVLNSTLTAEKVEKMKLAMRVKEAEIKIQAKWMEGTVKEMGETVNSMTPYYGEKAAAALAKTEDIQRYVHKLMTGIKSLDLYVGTDVEVTTVRTGDDAPEGMPLTIKQSKLFIEEELSVWADVGASFSFQDEKIFLKKLEESPELADQIFPTKRSVVCMSTSRYEKEFSSDAWLNAELNKKNREVFLLVRNGENIHKVWSPVESHLRSGRLFPTEREINDIFKNKKHRYYDDDSDDDVEINFMHTQYTDKLEEHEYVALHYKRFLILLAGLDHRLNLFGHFHNEGQSSAFLTQKFQQKYMEFLHDDDYNSMKQLTGERLPSFDEWINTKNAYLRSGSRVIGLWDVVMTSTTAPGAVHAVSGQHRDYDDFVAKPLTTSDVMVVTKDGEDFIIKVPVKRHSWRSDRKFEARVALNLFEPLNHGYGFLVIDAVKADELDYYIHSRTERKGFLNYIRLFKSVVDFLRKEEARQSKTRQSLIEAVEQGGVATGKRAAELVDQAIISYRAAARGAEIPPASDKVKYKQLLNQMFQLTQGDSMIGEAEKMAAEKGLEPLRLVVSGKSIIRLYCAPKPEEQDNRLFRHIWVHMFNLTTGKSGLRIADEKWKILPAATAAETTVKEWPGAAAWVGLEMLSPVDTYEKKQALFNEADNRDLPLFYQELDAAKLTSLKADWEHARRHMSDRYVANPAMTYQVGFVVKEKGDPKNVVISIEPLFAGVDAASFLHARMKGIKEKFESMYTKRMDRGDDLKNTAVRLQYTSEPRFLKSLKIVPGFSLPFGQYDEEASKKGLENTFKRSRSYSEKHFTVYLDAAFAKHLGVERCYRSEELHFKERDKGFREGSFTWRTREIRTWAPMFDPMKHIDRDTLEPVDLAEIDRIAPEIKEK